MAIKSVIEQGNIVSFSKNYKNKNYDRYIIASKGKIDNKNVIVGVVVNSYQDDKMNSKFYLHEAKIIETDSSFMTAPQLSVDTVNKSASTDSIFKNNENVKFSLRDSEYMSAVENGDTEKAQRLVDEAAKEAGYTIKAYHGTPNGDFTVFREWQYFTKNKEYADVYQGQGASSNGYKKTANNPKTYEVFLKPKKVFDTRNKTEREIFENEFYGQWGNGAPLSEKGLPDWTDGYDLIDFFEENGYNYDAILIDEGAVGGYGDDVKSRGISIVVKNSNQIKSAEPIVYDDNGNLIPLSERFNDSKSDIRYSLRDDMGEQIQSVLDNTHDKYNHIYMGNTPQTLVNILGLHKLPMLLTNNHAYSMTVSEKKAIADGKYKRNTHYHNLGIERMKQLPKKLNKPVMIIKSNTDSENLDIVVVTDMLDYNNRPVIAAIKPYGKGNYYDVVLDTNLLKSGYGKDNFYDYIDRAVKENRVLYFDKKSSQRLNTKWVQFPNNIESIDYNNSLSQYKQIVNNYYMQNSDENVKMSLRNLSPIERSANRILREYRSQSDLSSVAQQLKGIYTLIENGNNADSEIKALAQNIAENITEESERNEDYGYIKEFIQGYGMQVTDEIKSEFQSDWQRFFKKNNLRLKLNRNGKSSS